MPLIRSSYKAPLWIGGKHTQTIIPALFRKVEGVHYLRERISTEDRDFLDLDWSRIGSHKLVVISHGLEGSSRQPYVLGMVKEFNRRGWDALGWNFRSCSGEINHSLRFYNAASTPDLHTVLQHVAQTKNYKQIVLIGFSLGGNLTLKYLADFREKLPSELVKAVVFSVPCDLYACAQNLSHGINRIYLNRFLNTLREKFLLKAKSHPGLLSQFNFSKIKDFVDFDNYITAPLSGFKDAMHYYIACSSKHSIASIRVPTLLVNARNDPFLHPSCFPHTECHNSSTVFFEEPYDGGHLGFIQNTIQGTYWSEKRAASFCESC